MGYRCAKVAEDGCAVDVASDQGEEGTEGNEDPALFLGDGYPFWWLGWCGEECVGCVCAGAGGMGLGVFVVGGEGYVWRHCGIGG